MKGQQGGLLYINQPLDSHTHREILIHPSGFLPEQPGCGLCLLFGYGPYDMKTHATFSCMRLRSDCKTQCIAPLPTYDGLYIINGSPQGIFKKGHGFAAVHIDPPLGEDQNGIHGQRFHTVVAKSEKPAHL